MEGNKKEQYNKLRSCNVKMKAYMNLTLAMFISGSAVVASKSMVSTIPTFLATELGLMIGLLILVPLTFCIRRERFELDLKTHLIIFFQAFCGILLYRIFTFIGLGFTSAADSGLITSTSPVLVIVFAYIVLGEKVKIHQMAGIVLVFVGLLFIYLFPFLSNTVSNSSIKGNMLILAAVICEALFSVLSKVKCRAMTPLYRTTLVVTYAFIILLPLAIYDSESYNFIGMRVKTVGCILYYGVFVTFLSYVLWFRGIEKVNASNAACFTSVVPISSIFLSAVVLHEKIVLSHVISLVFVMAGIIISCMDTKFSMEHRKKIVDESYNRSQEI